MEDEMIPITPKMSKSEALAVQTLNENGGDVAATARALAAMKSTPPTGHTTRTISRATQFLWESYNRPTK